MTPELEQQAKRVTRTIAVLDLVVQERERQDAKWGADRNLDDGVWLKILVEEVGEVAKAMLEKEGLDHLVAELVQVAAVAVACVESIKRQQAEFREQATSL